MEFPKIENLWARDPETHVMSPENGYRHSSFSQVQSWLVLEKIDGMNMRVIWEPLNEIETFPLIFGRTSRADIPGDLMGRMKTYFTYETMAQAFMDEDGEFPTSVVLFGEGYGGKIQQGGHYREDKDFILFDVCVDGHWLQWSDVCDVAAKLGVETVPVLGRGMTTREAASVVEAMVIPGRMPSYALTHTPEGVIARTDPYLFTGRGNRVMFKHKVRDVAPYLESLNRMSMIHD